MTGNRDVDLKGVYIFYFSRYYQTAFPKGHNNSSFLQYTSQCLHQHWCSAVLNLTNINVLPTSTLSFHFVIIESVCIYLFIYCVYCIAVFNEKGDTNLFYIALGHSKCVSAVALCNRCTYCGCQNQIHAFDCKR